MADAMSMSKSTALTGKQPKRLGFLFWVSAGWIAFITLAACCAGWLPLREPDHMDWDHIASIPGACLLAPADGGPHDAATVQRVYLLGTDTMGRDILTRLIYGARISLLVGVLAPGIGLILGGALGLAAGFYRKWIETLITSIMDVILAFPALVLLLAVTFYLENSLANLVFALGLLTVPSFCRVARANTLLVAEREFVQAARLTGASDVSIMVREVIPNIILPLLVYALLVIAFMIMIEGALSFLGLSVPPPVPSWGGMISEGREMLDEAPHVSMIPAGVMFLTVLAFNLMGDTMRNILDRRKGQL